MAASIENTSFRACEFAAKGPKGERGLGQVSQPRLSCLNTPLSSDRSPEDIYLDTASAYRIAHLLLCDIQALGPSGVLPDVKGMW